MDAVYMGEFTIFFHSLYTKIGTYFQNLKGAGSSGAINSHKSKTKLAQGKKKHFEDQKAHVYSHDD